MRNSQPLLALLALPSLGLGLCLAADTHAPATQTMKLVSVADRAILTNDGVAILVRAGYSDQFILELIYQKQTRFDTSPEALAALAESGLSPRLVRYMIANPQKEALPEPVHPQAPVYTAPLRAERHGGAVVVTGASRIGGVYPAMGGGASFRAVSTGQGLHTVVPGPPGGNGFIFQTPAIYAAPAVTPVLVKPRWWQFFSPYWTYQSAGLTTPGYYLP